MVCTILYQVQRLRSVHENVSKISEFCKREEWWRVLLSIFLNNLNFIMKSSQNVILVVRDLRSVNKGVFWYEDSGFLGHYVVSTDIIYRRISASLSLSDCSTLKMKALRTLWHGVTYKKAWTLSNTAAITANHACFHLLVKPIEYFISLQTDTCQYSERWYCEKSYVKSVEPEFRVCKCILFTVIWFTFQLLTKPLQGCRR